MNRRASLVLMLLTPLRLADGQQKNKMPQCPDPPERYWDNCTGTHTFPNGNVYAGEFHKNTFNGQGYLTYSDGSTYSGEFRDGYLDGHGASTFPNGDKHVGEVHNNKANGHGTWTFANGDKYNGEFRDSQITGQGTYTFANGTKLVGEFKDGKFIGSSTFEVRLDKQRGVLVVPVLINDKIPLDFVVDSGASDVTVPADVVSTLMRTGTLAPTDFTGTQTYVLADGSQVPSQTFRIRSLKVGDWVLNNVTASVASANGSLLLGQSFLARFKSWSIDNVRQVLSLEPKLSRPSARGEEANH
jgi:clan AA aspartic protease (TIGR02281 family)